MQPSTGVLVGNGGVKPTSTGCATTPTSIGSRCHGDMEIGPEGLCEQAKTHEANMGKGFFSCAGIVFPNNP